MASEEQIAELKQKITILVDTKFGGDWTKAFNNYAGLSGKTGLVEREDLLQLLKDAEIGSWLTRGAWADGIIEELDNNDDAAISWTEFQSVLKNE